MPPSSTPSVFVRDLTADSAMPFELHCNFVLRKEDLDGKQYLQFALVDGTMAIPCVAFEGAARSIWELYRESVASSQSDTPRCVARFHSRSRVKERSLTFPVKLRAPYQGATISQFEVTIMSSARIGSDFVLDFEVGQPQDAAAIQALERSLAHVTLEPPAGISPTAALVVRGSTPQAPWVLDGGFYVRGVNLEAKTPYLQFVVVVSGTIAIAGVAFGVAARNLDAVVKANHYVESWPLLHCSLHVAVGPKVQVKPRNTDYGVKLPPCAQGITQTAEYEIQIGDKARIGADFHLSFPHAATILELGMEELAIATDVPVTATPVTPQPVRAVLEHQAQAPPPSQQDQAGPQQQPTPSDQGGGGSADGSPHQQHATQRAPLFRDAQPSTTAATSGRWVYTFKPSCFVPHQHFNCSILLRRDNLRWEADVVQRNVAEPATMKGAHSELVTGRGDVFEKCVLDYFQQQRDMVVEYGEGLEKAALSKMPNDELIAMLNGCVGQCKLRLEAGDTERCILAQVCLPVPPKLQSLLQLPGGANVRLRFSKCFPDFIVVTRCSSGQVSLRVTDTKSSLKRKRCHELQIAFYVACLQEWFEGNTTVTIDSGHGEVWLPQRSATTTEAPHRVDVFELPTRTTQGIEDFFSRDLASALQGVPSVPDGRDVALIGIEDAWLAKPASCENCSQLHACKSAAATGHVLATCGEARLLEAWPQRCRSFSSAQSARPSDGVLRGIVRKDFSAKHAKAVDLVYLRKAAPKSTTVFVVLSRGNPSKQPSGLQEENVSQTYVLAITFVASDDPQPILIHEDAQSLVTTLSRYKELSLVCWDVAQRRLLRQVMLGSGADGQSLAAAIFEDFSLMFTVDDPPRALESSSICATVKESFEALLDLSEPLPLTFGDVLRMEVVGSNSVAQPSVDHPLTTNDLFAPFYKDAATAVGPATVAMTRLSQQWSSFLKVAEDSHFVLEPPQVAAYDAEPSTLDGYFNRPNSRRALIRFLRRMTMFTACSDLEECVQGLQHPMQLSASTAAKQNAAATWCMELAWPERDQERLSVSDPSAGKLLGTYRYFLDLAGVKSVTDISDKYDSPFGSGRCDVILTESQPTGTVVGIKAASDKATKPPLLLTKRFMDFNTSKVVAALDASLEDNTPILSMILSEDPDIESDVEGERTSIIKWVESQHARGRVAPSEDQVPVLKQFMRYPRTLLWGPPGTGKTTTISHLLKYVAEHGLPELKKDKRKPRILITATTKDALHAIMGSLWKLFGKHNENVKGAPEDTIATLLLSNKGILGDHLPTVLYIDSVDMLSATVGSKAHRALGEDGVIVLTTPWQAHKFLSEKLGKKFKPFDALIIDEASQMPVAHALVASRLLNVEKHRVLCAGDLLQLPPILPEGIASSLSQFMKTHARTPRSDLLLSCSGSILQALMRGTDKSRLVDPSSFGSGAQQPEWLNLVQLEVSRRSVPRIVQFVGHIYPAQLRHGGPDADSADGQLLGPGTHELALHETSHEANSIVQLIVALRDRRAQSNAATKEVTIHVVTSHRRQRHAIQAALENEIPGLKEAGKLSIAVSTTEKSQGLEADIVVLAMADGISYTSPFPFNLFRLNVAISRAKHQVVVVVKSRAQMLEAAESVAAADGCPPASVKGARLLQRLVGLTTTW